MKNIKEKYADLSSKIYKMCNRKQLIRRRCLNLGKMECKMLDFLHSVDKPICMNELSKEMEVSNSRITRIIDALVAKEYVYRFPSKEDRRSWLVNITDSGREMHEIVSKDFLDLQAKLIASLPEHKIESILEDLNIYVNAYLKAINERDNEQ